MTFIVFDSDSTEILIPGLISNKTTLFHVMAWCSFYQYIFGLEVWYASFRFLKIMLSTIYLDTDCIADQVILTIFLLISLLI